MSTTVQLGKSNALKILKIFHQNKRMTKKEITDETKLTLMTVNKVVNDFLQKGIVVEEGMAESNTGRKANYYKFNSNIYYIIALNIGEKKITSNITNLSMEVVGETSILMKDRENPEEVIQQVVESVNKIIEICAVPIEKIAGMAISIRANVDSDAGIIVSQPRTKTWDNFPLRQSLQKYLNFPLVLIDRDAYTDALYLKWINPVENDGVIYITISGGIGAGILRQGKIYRGHNDLAGQIGHTTIDINGPRCKCGNIGCLEIFASEYAVENKIRKAVEDGANSLAWDISGKDLSMIDIGAIIQAARAGDVLCKKQLSEATRYLGFGISNMIKVYDPTSIVINCKWINEIDEYFDQLKQVVCESTTLISNDKILIRRASIPNIRMKGTAMLIVDYMVNNIDHNILIE